MHIHYTSYVSDCNTMTNLSDWRRAILILWPSMNSTRRAAICTLLALCFQSGYQHTIFLFEFEVALCSTALAFAAQIPLNLSVIKLLFDLLQIVRELWSFSCQVFCGISSALTVTAARDWCQIPPFTGHARLITLYGSLRYLPPCTSSLPCQVHARTLPGTPNFIGPSQLIHSPAGNV